MGKLYLKLATLCAIVLTVMYFITGFLDRLSTESLRSEKPFWVMNQRGKSYDFAVIGSSRAENCTDVRTIEKVTGKRGVNLGVQGACFADNLIMFRRFLENRNSARLLLLEVDEYAIDSKNSFMDPFKVQFYLPYLDDQWVREIVADNISGTRYHLWRYLPPTKYIEYNTMYLTYCLQYGLGRMAFDFDKTGGSRLETNQAPFVFDAAWVIKNRKKVKVIDGKDLKYLNRLIAYASERGVKVLLYTAPQYHEKLKYLENHRDFLAKMKDLSRFYNVGYCNYEYDDLTQDLALFMDASHMNAKGTVLFSTKLAEDVRKAL